MFVLVYVYITENVVRSPKKAMDRFAVIDVFVRVVGYKSIHDCWIFSICSIICVIADERDRKNNDNFQ